MNIDPRKADTLDEAARNADGTYDGARALSWLSDILTGGKGMPEGEVRAMFADAKANRSGNADAKGCIAATASHNGGSFRLQKRIRAS